EDRWKYIRYFEHSSLHRVTGDSMGGGAYRACLTGSFRRRSTQALYDCLEDPDELHDRADDPACAAQRARLRARMLAIMENTGDPLLHGPIASSVHHAAIASLRQAVDQPD
ncbi:MAG: hypothetical protein ACOCXA_02610, partial [Planctomycetota bacterium]